MIELDFDVNKVFQERLAASMGLDQYKYIMEKVKQVDVSLHTDFQRNFNGFYMVRRNEAWRKVYYDYFEKVKTDKPTFQEIIMHLFQYTGNIEPSFSSKMLATICPEKPIWDKYIVQNLGIELDGVTKDEKLKNAISLYSDIEKWYEKFLKTDKAKECIEAFDSVLPGYKWVSTIKKIDCIIWSIR
ncbi:MAG: hypothetical protein IJA01_07810 [Firmicutes bacterium]|nr:hypothetical protein [Bacillota bacterium]